jgi:hypothetical protein
MKYFRRSMAERFGLNAAVVADYLYAGEEDLPEMILLGKTWCRCSVKQINLDNPFLTVDQISYAISVLRDNGVINSKRIMKSKFDHTNWYAFTEYGDNLMKGGKV